MRDTDPFIEELDKIKNERIEQHDGPDETDRIIAWHQARATKNLANEAYRLRLSINEAKAAIEGASKDIKASIDTASAQSTLLGKRILWLNWALVAIAIVGIIFTGIKVYQEILGDNMLRAAFTSLSSTQPQLLHR